MAIQGHAHQQLLDAIRELKADIAELEGHLPVWNSEDVKGTNTYRPIAKQIIHAASRLEQIVRKNTYSP
jgi:hypothetical protein